jgi:hypothetical protein
MLKALLSKLLDDPHYGKATVEVYKSIMDVENRSGLCAPKLLLLWFNVKNGTSPRLNFSHEAELFYVDQALKC